MEIPTLNLKVESFSDSHGIKEYNLWLSKRSAESTVNYLIAKGIDVSRLSYEAYGEKQLANHCDNHTYCSEEKHKMNRRSEFTVIEF
ncbi:MAG: OmpA family protein [Eudoraea sp.]|uniref:OmpA family protein n=1 Tax=Eudoraea sp. TaxID=1979955 RepID=UPI0032631C6D